MLPHVAIVTLTATVHAKGSEIRIDLHSCSGLIRRLSRTVRKKKQVP